MARSVGARGEDRLGKTKLCESGTSNCEIRQIKVEDVREMAEWVS